MTLVASLRCSEGAVLASDSRETTGPVQERVARSATKIYQPRAGFLLASAGHRTVTQAFALAMQRDRALSTALDRVDVERRLEGLIAQIREAGKTDLAEWLVAWWSQPDDAPVVLQLFSGRAGQWVESWGFGGDRRPQDIAHIVSEAIRFVPRDTLTLEQAKLVALKVMRDTIHIGVESIGGEVQIGSVNREGVEIIAGAELVGLHHALGVWEEQAAALLPGSTPVPAESATPDRGVRPPGSAPRRTGNEPRRER